MEPKNLAAIIDLLGPDEFEEFKEILRREVRLELEQTLQGTIQREISGALGEKKCLQEANDLLQKRVLSYRTSIAKLETHIRRVLIYYNIPLEKLEKEENGQTSAAPAIAASSPVKPAAPSSVSQFPPSVTEPIIRSRFRKRNLAVPEDLPSKEEKEEVLRKIEEALREAPVHKRGLTVQDVYLYLEKVAKLPIYAPRWQYRGKSGQTRIRSTIYNRLYELRMAGKLGKKAEYWYWIDDKKD